MIRLWGWAVGLNGVTLKTTNGGSVWTKQSLGTQEELKSIIFVSSKLGWTVGDRGVIIKTTDGGVSWVNSSSAYPPPSAWDYIVRTGENQVIMIKPTSIITIDENPIKNNDVIAVFYKRNDSLFCAGYGKWLSGQNIAFTVWGDNPFTGVKDGMGDNETFTIQIWDSEKGTIVNVYPYQITFEKETQKNYLADQISFISSIKATKFQGQRIPINMGWSMIFRKFICV